MDEGRDSFGVEDWERVLVELMEECRDAGGDVSGSSFGGEVVGRSQRATRRSSESAKTIKLGRDLWRNRKSVKLDSSLSLSRYTHLICSNCGDFGEGKSIVEVGGRI